MVNDAGRKEVDAALETLERRIIREYAQAETEVQTKMDAFLKKFEAQDKEFQALVDKGEMDVGKYIQWRQKQILTSTYWRDMRDTLAQDYINVDKIVKHMTGEHVYDVYAMGRNYGAYEVEHRTSLDTSFTLYNHEAVERLIRDDPDLLPMPGEATRKSISEGKLKAWNRKQLQSAMTQSILQGEPIDKIAKRVATAVGGMDTKAAIRTARTATTSAESAGRRDSYKRAQDMGIKLKQMWVATLDGRTRHEHRQLDGQTCEVGGKFKIDGEEIEYPGDPTAPGYLVYNCRCAMVAVIPGTQLAEEGITGVERDDRLEDMSYEEWKNEKAKAQVEPEFHIAEGTDITGTWERRSDQFAFEIEDVINAQGFDGVPRVVDAEEFDRAVAAANGGKGFIAQRTYSGPTQEVVDEYRRQLYEDHWYVDCSTGGAQYGQGMYCAADYTGQLSDGIQTEMQHYIDLNETRLSQNYSGMSVEDRQVALPSIIDELRPDLPADQKAALRDFVTYDTLNDADTVSFERAAEARKLLMDNDVNIGQFEFELETYRTHPYANVETLTLDPSAKIIAYRELDDLRTYTGLETRLANALDVPTETKKALLAWVESEEEASSLTGQVRKYAESIEQKADKLINMDCGALAAALGYDAIDASGHGQSGSYTVILNRTKVIFRREN